MIASFASGIKINMAYKQPHTTYFPHSKRRLAKFIYPRTLLFKSSIPIYIIYNHNFVYRLRLPRPLLPQSHHFLHDILEIIRKCFSCWPYLRFSRTCLLQELFTKDMAYKS
ncbi:hypothetical protein CEXT_255201 [Caerostris extrusa]|uniref:Uncharacterized protein n=1 Tax=Caerostris extrusa TaxID=172846 RepID=A0AAV4MWZ1_CAEEX|nr:hypothetical protein CEXT_255201 [Caerostris extrusa]